MAIGTDIEKITSSNSTGHEWVAPPPGFGSAQVCKYCGQRDIAPYNSMPCSTGHSLVAELQTKSDYEPT